MLNFQINLSYESRDNVFNGDDVDSIFNNFLSTYLRIFYHTFPLTKCRNNYNYKPWITPGIITSSQHKRDLCMLCRSTKDPKLNTYYKKYCKILSDVIKTAKTRHYNNLLISSNNKAKTSWQIIESVTNKTKCNHGISSLEIDGKTCNDSLGIAKAFNTYFTTSTEKISVSNPGYPHLAPSNVCPSTYLKQVFSKPFPGINFTPTTTKAITEIVNSLKSTNSQVMMEVPIRVLKCSLPFIISPLLYICNKSLIKGTFPTRLKFSQIIPIVRSRTKATELYNPTTKKREKIRNFKLQANLLTDILF